MSRGSMLSIWKHKLQHQRLKETDGLLLLEKSGGSTQNKLATLQTVAIALLGLMTVYPSLVAQANTAKPSGKQTPQAVLDGTARLIGHSNAAQMLRLVIGLNPPHLQEEDQFLEQLQDKNSHEFHHFLTAKEWNARFGPSAQDEQAVADWARSQGLTITHRYPNRLLVDVEAPAAAIEKAFSVTLNNYQLGASSFFSNDRDPVLPAQLVSVVQSIGGLNSLHVLHPANKNAVEPAFPVYTSGAVHAPGNSGGHDGKQSKRPAFSASAGKNGPTHNMTGGAYDPTDMYSSQAYDTNALYNLGHCCNPLQNAGSTPPETSIAIATAGTQDGNDFAGFHNQYPYLADHWQQFYIDGTPVCCDGEGTMDMEWSTAMSNSFGSYVDTSMIYMYDGVNANFSTFNDVYNHILTDGKARVFSTSWGCAELSCYDSTDMDTAHSIFNQMVGQGWTMVAASGDQGATAGCGNADRVQFPSSDPNVVGAGGTTLSLSAGPSFSSEVAWSGGPAGCASNDGGSTGGLSAYYSTPSYQNGLGLSSRGVPDISLNADWYYTPQNYFFGGALSGNGGTSIVAPEMAGFFAQENAYLLYLSTITGGLCNGHSCAPMGNANWYLYWFGKNPGYAPHYPFYDTTSGCNNNDVTALYGLGYSCAGTGYDTVTGWGSVNMLQLAWAINTYQTGDFGAPTAAFSGPATATWYNTDQTVSWTLTDTTANGLPATGVAGYSSAWDTDPGDVFSEATPGAGNSFYSGPLVANATTGSLDLASAGEGCHTANLRAWDNTGVASGDLTYGSLCYDTIAPTSWATKTPSPNVYGWNKSSVQVTLSSSDPGAGSTGSGIAATYYALDNAACAPINLGACLVYISPLNITTQANHVIYFFSKDRAGNFSGKNSVAVKIDETAPHTSASLGGTKSLTIFITPVLVTLNRTDNLSGIATTVYQIDGGAVHNYTGSFTVSLAGSHKVTFHSTDKAGNVEVTGLVSFAIKAATTTTLVSSLNPSLHTHAVTFTATVLPKATFTGVAAGTVTFKDGAVVLGTGTINATTHKAQFTKLTFTVGTHSITAVYGGATYYFGSTSAILKQVVN